MKTREVNIQFGDREPENPFARYFSAIAVSFAGVTVIALMAVASVAVAILAIVLTIAFSPVLVPLHYILRACGRQGFCRSTGNKLEIKISWKAFRKFGTQS